jgi:hypothetical protein
MKLLCHQRVGWVVYYCISDRMVGGVLMNLLCHQRVAEKCCFWGMRDMGVKGLAKFLCHHIVGGSFLANG